MGFYLYRGLKKPLVFFGLKDKYIYYALGFVVLGFISVAVLSSLIGVVGLLGGAVAGGGVWWVFRLQDTKGLYNKTKNNNELHIFPKRFKKLKSKKH